MRDRECDQNRCRCAMPRPDRWDGLARSETARNPVDDITYDLRARGHRSTAGHRRPCRPGPDAHSHRIRLGGALSRVCYLRLRSHRPVWMVATQIGPFCAFPTDRTTGLFHHRTNTSLFEGQGGATSLFPQRALSARLEHPGFHAHLVLCDAASPGGSAVKRLPGLEPRPGFVISPLRLTIERQFIMFAWRSRFPQTAATTRPARRAPGRGRPWA